MAYYGNSIIKIGLVPTNSTLIGIIGDTGPRGPAGPTGPTGPTGPQDLGFLDYTPSSGITALDISSNYNHTAVLWSNGQLGIYGHCATGILSSFYNVVEISTSYNKTIWRTSTGQIGVKCVSPPNQPNGAACGDVASSGGGCSKGIDPCCGNDSDPRCGGGGSIGGTVSTNVAQTFTESLTGCSAPSGTGIATSIAATNRTTALVELLSGITYQPMVWGVQQNIYDLNSGSTSPIKIYGGAWNYISKLSSSSSTIIESSGITLFGIHPVPPGIAATNFTDSISIGYDNACGIRSDGIVVCWGNNYSNQVWSSGEQIGPTGLTAYGVKTSYGACTSVSVGLNHICAIKTNGQVVCWGNPASNLYGALSVPSGLTALKVSCGNYSTTAINQDGRIVGWGLNRSNNLTIIPSPFIGTPPTPRFIQKSTTNGFYEVQTTTGRILPIGSIVGNSPNLSDFKNKWQATSGHIAYDVGGLTTSTSLNFNIFASELNDPTKSVITGTTSYFAPIAVIGSLGLTISNGDLVFSQKTTGSGFGISNAVLFSVGNTGSPILDSNSNNVIFRYQDYSVANIRMASVILNKFLLAKNRPGIINKNVNDTSGNLSGTSITSTLLGVAFNNIYTDGSGIMKNQMLYGATTASGKNIVTSLINTTRTIPYSLQGYGSCCCCNSSSEYFNNKQRCIDYVTRDFCDNIVGTVLIGESRYGYPFFKENMSCAQRRGETLCNSIGCCCINGLTGAPYTKAQCLGISGEWATFCSGTACG